MSHKVHQRERDPSVVPMSNKNKKSSSASNPSSNEIEMGRPTPAPLLPSGENLAIANPDIFLGGLPFIRATTYV